jgi:putative cardiolipin synthase
MIDAGTDSRPPILHFRGDETGLLTDALLRAAERGVRVRVLIDDGDTIAGDEQLIALATHPGIEIRIFNPFAYRGHQAALRALEFGTDSTRLDYRMHNKLLIADNALALIGGRNIGNQYFQMDPESQFADDDVLSAGPIAVLLSATFDEYWNNPLAIPAEALAHSNSGIPTADHRVREQERQQLLPLKTDGIDYVTQLANLRAYTGILWPLAARGAQAQLICDSRIRRAWDSGAVPGRLMSQAVTAPRVRCRSNC